MGLLTIIRKNKAKSKEMRVLFLGLDNAGKTTILKKLMGEDISSISPTLGFNIKTLIRNGYTLNVWDVGGQRTLRPYWRNYFESTDAVVWVVDSSDRLRVTDCKDELRTLLQEERLSGATLLVFANKQDINGSMSLAEIRDGLDLPGIKSHKWAIHSCSAVTGQGLEGGMDWTISEVAGRLYWNASTPAPTPTPAPIPATTTTTQFPSSAAESGSEQQTTNTTTTTTTTTAAAVLV